MPSLRLPRPGRPRPAATPGVPAVVSGLLDRAGVPAGARPLFAAAGEYLWEEAAKIADDEGMRSWSNPRRRLAALREQLGRLEPAMRRCQAAAIAAGTHYPAPARRGWTPPARAGAATATVTLAEQFVVYGTLTGAATGVMVTTALVELVETYLAASARANQYRAQGLACNPDTVARDLHAATREGAERNGLGRSIALGVDQLFEELGKWMVKRTASALWEVLAAGVGPGWAGVSSALLVRRVGKVPLRQGEAPGEPPPPPGKERWLGWLRSQSSAGRALGVPE